MALWFSTLEKYLAELNITKEECAKLLGLKDQEMDDFINKSEVSAPCEQAIMAWYSLERFSLPWRPDSYHFCSEKYEYNPFTEESYADDLAAQIGHSRNYEMGMSRWIKKGEKSSELKSAWEVNLKRMVIKIGKLEINFKVIDMNKFTFLSYKNFGGLLNLEIDEEFLAPAAYILDKCLEGMLFRCRFSGQYKFSKESFIQETIDGEVQDNQ